MFPSSSPAFGEFDTGVLRDWIAKRYLRPAFPDEFNRRISSQRKAIEKFTKDAGCLFVDIYVDCDPRHNDLPGDREYKVTIWIAMKFADFDNETLRREALEACGVLESALSRCKGLAINECEVRHERQITLDDLRWFRRWDFDYLTHQQGNQRR